jgi:hypothetical protein
MFLHKFQSRVAALVVAVYTLYTPPFRAIAAAAAPEPSSTAVDPARHLLLSLPLLP